MRRQTKHWDGEEATTWIGNGATSAVSSIDTVLKSRPVTGNRGSDLSTICILRSRAIRPIVSLACFLTCAWSVTASAESDQAHSSGHNATELLAFVSFDYAHVFDAEDMADVSSDATPAIDILFGNAGERWRFLAEYLWTDDEAELERLQLGYDATEESTLWIGRFHQPTSAWVAKYHHGRFLQTSISRPAIEEWEDDGGVIPAHISGFMIDQGIPLDGGRGARVSMAIGVGPELTSGELRPFDFFDPTGTENKLSAGISFAYFPDYLASTNFGFSATHSQIVVTENPFLGITAPFEIDQTTLGVQIDWRGGKWQILSAAYYVHSRTDLPADQFGDWFVSGYAELQHVANEDSTYFGRLEASANADEAEYLDLFPDFAEGRFVLGYRRELTDSQALSFEMSDENWLTGSFRQARIQWSAVFP